MTKLKTLKDLEKEWKKADFSIQRDIGKDLFLKELKAEAVKWRKKLLGDIGFVTRQAEKDRIAICKFIDEFFNLTEEDLKC